MKNVSQYMSSYSRLRERARKCHILVYMCTRLCPYTHYVLYNYATVYNWLIALYEERIA